MARSVPILRKPGGRPENLRALAAFTLLEIMTAIVVILILVMLLVPAYENVRMRTDKIACSNNLRQLYVAAEAYVQQYGQWPQVSSALLKQPNNAYDEAWIETFIPLGVSRNSWICPTTERDLGGPDFTQKTNYRADYLAMPYDAKHQTPYEWPTSPWFVERGNVHGNGNLVIQANGAIIELSQMSTGVSTAPAQ